LLVLSPAHAAYPDRPLRLIVTFPPGSGSDFVARLVGAEMSKQLGQPIVVENRDGGSSTIGMKTAAMQPADGYTLVLFGSTPAVINVSMFRHLSYDPIKDFTPIGLVGESPLVLVSTPGRHFKSTADLIAYGLANPGALNFGHSSTATQVAAAAFLQQGKFQATFIGYRGTPQLLLDLMAGQIDAAFLDYPFAISQINSGKVKGLGVTSLERFPLSPDIPTVADVLPGFELKTFTGLAAAGRVAPDVRDKLSTAFRAALRSTSVVKKLEENGIAVKATSPADFDAFVKTQIEVWAALIHSAGISPLD
jgi:tripartite-type tricarboxylate transporter receptor subunit TctC